MKDLFVQTINTPWKAVNEILMYLIKPFVFFYIRVLCNIVIYPGAKFYGFPIILKHSGSNIKIGKKFEDRNWVFSNPLGVNHSTVISTWKKNAKILIGNDVGISGGSIVAASSISIGDGTLIGANSVIIDTDFHPLGTGRRYSLNGVKSKPVTIGKNVFIGMNCIILKGVSIPDDAIVPAGSVIRRWKSIK